MQEMRTGNAEELQQGLGFEHYHSSMKAAQIQAAMMHALP